MQVMLAQPRGFCAGVIRAIDIVEQALAKFGAPVYVRHEIVHNRHVVESLRAKGARFVENLTEVPAGAITIFSAHGVARVVELDARGPLDERAARLARLFRQARSARALDDAALVRVRARLRAGRRGRDARGGSDALGVAASLGRPPGLAGWRPTPAMAVGFALLALAGAAMAELGSRSFRRVGAAALRPTPTTTETVPGVWAASYSSPTTAIPCSP